MSLMQGQAGSTCYLRYTNLIIIPSRPICRGNNHPTENISCFVDFHIHKYVAKLPAYVRDTQHFIKQLKGMERIQDSAILATLDVCSFYTNILNTEAIDAILDHMKRDHSADIPSYRMGKLLNMVLHMSHFTFNKKSCIARYWASYGDFLCPPPWPGQPLHGEM